MASIKAILIPVMMSVASLALTYAQTEPLLTINSISLIASTNNDLETAGRGAPAATVLPITWYADNDGDGYGNHSVTLMSVSQPPGYVSDSTDCNDSNFYIHPGADEVCNGIDDNCNNLTDDNDPSIIGQPAWYSDNDGDGFGNNAISVSSCSQPIGFVSDHSDCNDSNAAIHPGAPELCNGLDDNCDGLIDAAYGNIIGVNPGTPDLYIFNSTTLVLISTGTLTLPGYIVLGGLAIDRNPVNGLYYAIVKVSGSSQRRLVTVDPATGICIMVGNLGDQFASLTFTPAGKLFAVTGDGAAVPETLYKINSSNAAKTYLNFLGNGADGEVIAFNKDDGYIYHWSGNGDPVFEKIDTVSYTTTAIAETGYGHIEIFGAFYLGGGNFMLSDINSEFIEEHSTGYCTFRLNHGINNVRGLAGSLPTTISCNVTIHLKAFVEGFYLGGDSMRAAIDPVNQPHLCDTFTLILASYANPDSMPFSATSVMNIYGQVTFTLPAIVNGHRFYFILRHRNSLTTWSAGADTIVNNMTYEFSTGASKAFGNNMKDLGDGNFALWSGDVNQDGQIESFDYSEIENAVQQFIFSYHLDDVTGDDQVESADYSMIENNVQSFIFLARP